MKDLTTLVQHPSMQGAERIVLLSGKPIILVRGDEKKGVGQPLANQHIMNLLKASLPQELLATFGWGKELNHDLDVDGRPYPLRIVLKPDKSFHIEITMEAAASEPEPESEEPPTELALSAPMPSFIEEPPTVPVAATPPPQKPTPTAAATGDEPSEALIEELITGNNLALIYYSDQKYLAQIEQAVGDFGYEPKHCNQAAAIIEVLKYQDYPLFIMQLDEHFAQDPVYCNLATMNMNRRRKQFSVLVTPGVKTNDALSAFSLSVNQLVATAEIHLLYEHVHAQMGSWKRFVGAFHEILDSAGKL